MRKKYIIGVDLGGTKTAVGLSDAKGKLLKEIFTPTPRASAEKIYQNILRAIKNIILPRSLREIIGIGLGLPGLVDIKKGTVLNAPNLPPWSGFPVAKRLKRDLGLPIIVDNDANAAALAESLFGSGKKYNNFVYITVSTGIGSGIIIDKKIYYGSHLTAGEIGHIIIEAKSGIEVKNTGKLEFLASGTGLAKKAVSVMKTSSLIYKISHGIPGKMTGEVVYTSAKNGDALAKKLVAEQGIYLAAGIANITNILDPEAIIIGGGVASNWKTFSNAIQQGLKYFELMTPNKKVKLLPAKLKKHAGLYGAIALVMQQASGKWQVSRDK